MGIANLLHKCTFFVEILLSVGVSNFTEHTNGSNNTTDVKKIADGIVGEGDKLKKAEIVKYSIIGYACLVVILHLYLKYQHKKEVEGRQNEENLN